MAVYVAEAQVHIQRLATALKKSNTEDQRCGVRLFWVKRSQYKGYSLRNVSCLRREVFVA
jgi:hypothetical protein